MSTICKICINTKANDVIDFLKTRYSNLSESFELSETERPLIAIERQNFQRDNQLPTIFSCKQVTEKTTEIHFNSFNRMELFLSEITQAYKCIAVLNIYQSTATACCWSYYFEGDKLREIESADFEILIDSGIKFDFESENTGRDISEQGDEPSYHFDYNDMDLYNENVDIDVEVYQQLEAGWVNLKIETDDQIKPMPKQSKWWVFWK